MEIVKNIALISINATLVVQLISFLIFMWLFNRLMIRPLREVMVERKQFIDQLRGQIVAADDEFKNVADQITVQQQQARQSAMTMRADMESTAQQSATVTLAQTKKEIGALKEKAQKRTQQSIAEARGQMQAEADVLSDQMVAALLRSRSTP